LFFIKHNELFQILVYSSFVIKLTSLCTTGDIEKTTGKENMKENPHVDITSDIRHDINNDIISE